MDYESKIIESSRELSAKEKLAIKDCSNAKSLDEISENERLRIHPQLYAVCAIHNEKATDKKDYKKYIVVVNKKDLENKLNIANYNFENIVYTDTISVDGIEELKNKIISMFNLDEIEQNYCEIFTNMRQITLAKESLSILSDVEGGIALSVPVDMLEIDIKRIWEKLGEILGENYSDELIDQLFSQFCLGK